MSTHNRLCLNLRLSVEMLQFLPFKHCDLASTSSRGKVLHSSSHFPTLQFHFVFVFFIYLFLTRFFSCKSSYRMPGGHCGPKNYPKAN